MVAEDTLAGVEIPEAKITLVDKYFGFAALRQDVENGVFPIDDARVMVLTIGRAEAFSREADFSWEAERLVSAIHALKPEAWIIFSSPFPRWHDDARRVRKLHAVGALLRKLTDQPRVLFCNLADRITSPTGVNAEMLTERGLSDRGKATIRAQLLEFLQRHGLKSSVPDLRVTVRY